MSLKVEDRDSNRKYLSVVYIIPVGSTPTWLQQRRRRRRHGLLTHTRTTTSTVQMTTMNTRLACAQNPLQLVRKIRAVLQLPFRFHKQTTDSENNASKNDREVDTTDK
mmetsp:Transcript_3401/g.8080  ORF Transcript_3401/g.8080 Transcript_3401/m.8080 type:complete len:108 (-) Transcript_3401:421-744(-)